MNAVNRYWVLIWVCWTCVCTQARCENSGFAGCSLWITCVGWHFYFFGLVHPLELGSKSKCCWKFELWRVFPWQLTPGTHVTSSCGTLLCLDNYLTQLLHIVVSVYTLVVLLGYSQWSFISNFHVSICDVVERQWREKRGVSSWWDHMGTLSNTFTLLHVLSMKQQN